MKNYNRLNARNVSLLVAASLGIVAVSENAVDKIKKPTPVVQEMPSRNYPMNRGNIRPMQKLPETIPKGHIERQNEVRLPFGKYLNPSKKGDYLNISLQKVRNEELQDIKYIEEELDIVCGPGVKRMVSSVPVYTYTDGKPTEVPMSYISGTDEIIGSEMLDLPEGQDAEQSAFFGYFEGKLHHFDAYVAASDPVSEPEFKDDIHLPLPRDVEILPEVICDNDPPYPHTP